MSFRPGNTTVVDSWSVPGTDGAEYFELLASGALNAYGGATVGQLNYIAVSNVPSQQYHFPDDGVFAYTGLPSTKREGTRYFVAMNVLAYG